MDAAYALMSQPNLTNQQYDAAKTLYEFRAAVVAASDC
jgi:hypothetical protein